MSYPQYPQMPQVPAHPAPVVPAYPQQPPTYPVAQPQYPQVPAQPTAYPQVPQYPIQQPAAPVPATPPQPAVTGSLDAFYSQPASGAKAWIFDGMPIGTTYVGMVERPLTNGDIQQQTDRNTGALRFFKNGQPMWVMIVPLIVQPDARHPEGKATWWVKGAARDELARAMAEAGAPEGPPEPGAVITVTKSGTRPTRSGTAFTYTVRYQRPQGAAPVTQDTGAGAPAAPVPPQVAQPAPAPVPTQPAAVPVPPQMPVPQPAVVPQAPAQPAQGSAFVQAAQPDPAGLSADQMALLATLTGQQPPQPAA